MRLHLQTAGVVGFACAHFCSHGTQDLGDVPFGIAGVVHPRGCVALARLATAQSAHPLDGEHIEGITYSRGEPMSTNLTDSERLDRVEVALAEVARRLIVMLGRYGWRDSDTVNELLAEAAERNEKETADA